VNLAPPAVGLHSGEPLLTAQAVARLLEELGVDDATLARLNALGGAIRDAAPEVLAPARREKLLADATNQFFLPLLQAVMSEPQKAILEALSRGELTRDWLVAGLTAWAASINPEEPTARIQRDCLPLQEILGAGASRAYGKDTVRCEGALAAVARFASLQYAVIAAAVGAARRREPGRAELMPDYAPFVERLRERIESCAAEGRRLAVMYVDCGVIARIDGAWGFHAGDAVRARIFGRMKSDVLRPQDLLGEIGRDEFACVLDPVDGGGLASLAAQKTLRTLTAPLRSTDADVYAKPSIGIALYPEHGHSPAPLLQRAKIACVAARESVERIALYSEQQEDPHAGLLLHEGRLRAAIESSTLALAFQPQVRLADRRIVGVESLLRWNDSVLGMVPPGKAIAVADSAGLANEITWWVLNNALRHCAEFRARGLDLRVGVNLTAHNLRERDLPDFVDRALRTWGLPGERLVIEVAETAVIGAGEAIAGNFARLKALGVRLAIDDFGTGYSSMNYLATLPFDEMKIDLSFVSDMGRVPQHERIVRSLIHLAHELGLVVVAEGVEDAAVAQRLAELGCDLMQGYFTSAPLDPEGLVAAYGAATGTRTASSARA
jgi:diguanylate cyclase (GGDEF)-like protein